MPNTKTYPYEARITEDLAQRIFGWRCFPDRFLTGNRKWIPKWRFAPFERLDDAIRLLDAAADNYRLFGTGKGRAFSAVVRVNKRVGKAHGEPKARSITTALAIALGLIDNNKSRVASFRRGVAD